MQTQSIGQQHGAAVRRVAGFGVKLVVALGKDIALNIRRGGGYIGGFASGLVRGETGIPNA